MNEINISNTGKSCAPTWTALMFLASVLLGWMHVAFAARSGPLVDDVTALSVGEDVTNLAWSKNGAYLALQSDKSVHLVDAAKRQEVWSVGRVGARLANGLCFINGDQEIVAPAFLNRDRKGSISQVVFTVIPIANPADYQLIKNEDPTSSWAVATAFATDEAGEKLFVADGPATSRGLIAAYTMDHWQRDKIAGPIGTEISHMAYFNGLLAVDSGVGDIKILSSRNGKDLSTFTVSQTGFDALTFNPVSGAILTGGNGITTGRAVYPPLPAGVVVGSLEPAQVEAWKAYIASAKKITLQDDPTKLVKAWEPRTGALLETYVGTTSGISSISVSSNGHYVAAIEGGSLSGITLLVWDANTAELIEKRSYGRANTGRAAFAPDGRTLAVTVGRAVHLISISG